MEFDLIITNGIIATASDVLSGLELGISDGTITCIAKKLARSSHTQVINADGAYITPGGIDSHVHIQQDNAPTGDTFPTGSRSAVAGGNTCYLSFASQDKDQKSLQNMLADYCALADDKSYCDYGIHIILTNPTMNILQDELPDLVAKGFTSIKIYMTYEHLKIGDKEILRIMQYARSLGITVMVHAENDDMITFITEHLESKGHTDPFFHSIAHARIAETEATYRAIQIADLMDTPILLVHMNSETAMRHVRDSQTNLLPIFAETCPQYLYLLSEKMTKPHFHGAKCVCSPPLRHEEKDLDAMWRGIANGTFTTFSSDHAPSKYDHPDGKKKGLINNVAKFKSIPNGLPGIETRLPLLYQGVEKGRLTIQRFVELTSTNPAKLYGLPTKGSLAPGLDADICIWYPESKMEPFLLKNDMLHHDIDYTPYDGLRFTNWPRYTICRGKVVFDRDHGGIKGDLGYGNFVKRTTSSMKVHKREGDEHGRRYWT